MSSSSSTELAGFRLERELGRGAGSVVYEATQLSLHRRVAVKVIEGDGAPALRWPEHPHVVSLYAAGPCEDGWFVAMQLIRGTSLARLLQTRRPRADVLARQLRDVGAALDAAHREGIAHGAVGARNVLIDGDGRAYLTDFQLRPGLASPESDRADFAALVGRCLGTAPVDPLPESARALVPAVRARGRRGLWAAAAAAVAALGAAAAVVAWPDHGSVAVSPLLGGAAVLGSPLSGGGVHTVDCSGAGPSGASEPCVLVQTHLDGRPVTALESGVVRRWTVRGARGQIALTVLRRRDSQTAVVARSRYATIRDGGLHTLRANLPVRAGELVGLALAPDGGVGVRDSAGATLRRRLGPGDVAPGPFATGEEARELMLRVEYLPGAKWRPAGLLTGRRAARAPAADPSQVLQLQGSMSVAAVIVGEQVAADLYNGKRRVARLFVPGASLTGRLASLYTLRLDHDKATVRIVWSNPLGTVSRDFTVSPRALVPLD
jgi:hypothetical protein